MNDENAPTMEHVLIGREDFVEARQRDYDAGNVRQLFQEVSVTEVFDFLAII